MRISRAIVAALAVGLVAVACGTEGGSDAEAAATQVDVTATEYGYTGLDGLQPGETEFTMRNAGEEIHDMAVIEWEPPEDPEALPGAGALFVAPGTTAPAGLVVDLTPGTWTFICFLETEDGMPHAELGMIKTIEVT